MTIPSDNDVTVINGGTLNPVATVDAVQDVTAGGKAGADGGSSVRQTTASRLPKNVIQFQRGVVTSKPVMTD